MDGRTRRRLDTRRQLLDAGRDLLREGHDELTVAAILERADVSHGSFYNHFASLHEFHEHLVHNEADKVLRALLESLCAEDLEDSRVVLAFVVAHLLNELRNDARAAVVTRNIPAGYGDQFQEDIAFRVALVEQGIARGDFPEQDPALLEISIRRVLDGSITHFVDGGFTDGAELEVARLCLRLAGVAPDDVEAVLARVAGTFE